MGNIKVVNLPVNPLYNLLHNLEYKWSQLTDVILRGDLCPEALTGRWCPCNCEHHHAATIISRRFTIPQRYLQRMCFEWGRNYSRYVHKHFEDFLFIQTPLNPLTNFCKIRAAFPERSHACTNHCLSIPNQPGTETTFNIQSHWV